VRVCSVYVYNTCICVYYTVGLYIEKLLLTCKDAEKLSQRMGKHTPDIQTKRDME
jgi:hypothetical protein